MINHNLWVNIVYIFFFKMKHHTTWKEFFFHLVSKPGSFIIFIAENARSVVAVKTWLNESIYQPREKAELSLSQLIVYITAQERTIPENLYQKLLDACSVLTVTLKPLLQMYQSLQDKTSQQVCKSCQYCANTTKNTLITALTNIKGMQPRII